MMHLSRISHKIYIICKTGFDMYIVLFEQWTSSIIGKKTKKVVHSNLRKNIVQFKLNIRKQIKVYSSHYWQKKYPCGKSLFRLFAIKILLVIMIIYFPFIIISSCTFCLSNIKLSSLSQFFLSYFTETERIILMLLSFSYSAVHSH